MRALNESLSFAVVSLVISLCLLGWAALLVGYHHFAQDLPSLEVLESDYRPPTVSYFYAADGRVIGEFAREHRLVTPLDRIPRRVIQAFIAAEDRNFYEHPGVDLAGILRAMVKNVEAGRIVQGGSTITQQVTRSFLLSNERSFRRKIREAILAWRIEQNFSKDEILFLYLNQPYLGRGAYGVASAALLYFGKKVEDLTLAEGAFMAGLDPFSGPVFH